MMLRKASTKTPTKTFQFSENFQVGVSLSLRGDGPCPSQGLVPCVGRHCVPQRTAKADARQARAISPNGWSKTGG